MPSPSADSMSQTLEACYGAVPQAELVATVDRFVRDAFDFANRSVGIGDLKDAWSAFRVWQALQVDPRVEDWRLFAAWYAFHWFPYRRGQSLRPQGLSIAERYLREHPADQVPEIHHLVQSAVSTPLDFYEVHQFPELGCYYLKSLLLGFKQSYVFPEIPAGLRLGDVFFGKVVHLYADRGILVGASKAFPSLAKLKIARLRREFIRNRAKDYVFDFCLFDSDVFNVYHDLRGGDFGSS